MPIEDVVVLHGDTNVSHYGRDTYGSRGTAVGGSAIVMCIDKIVAKAKKLAAHQFETTTVMSIREGRSSARRHESPDWVGREAGEAYIAKNCPPRRTGLERRALERRTSPSVRYTYRVVEVDRDTGHVADQGLVAVDDCGPQINPLIVEGQVQADRAFNRQVLFEHTIYDENGQLLTGEFMDYAIPRAEDIPEYILGSTVTPTFVNPLGVKGVGEAGTIGATPAIANAVLDALEPLGIAHLDLPMTPERVWQAIKAKTRAAVTA